VSSTPEPIGRRRFDGPPRIALEPPGPRSWLSEAIEAGGAQIVPLPDAEAIVWATPTGPDELAATVASASGVHWVQLPWAGVEPFVAVLDHDHLWTCGKGVYAEPVAEHILTLALAGMRGLGTYLRATSWGTPQGRNLLGGNVVILGGGGIATSLLRLLGPFGAHVTVLRRHPQPMAGADRVGTLDDLDDVLPAADLVVLALALTPETVGVLDRRRLALMSPTAWIVNLGRGRHIVTDDLVDALRNGTIGGAAVDVTDPEPLPRGHPLWTMPNAIVTPHIGNTPEMAQPLLKARVTENMRRFARGEPLVGTVDVDAGY
jgi:phosphoglycerate dehydrogenase-like enzyme